MNEFTKEELEGIEQSLQYVMACAPCGDSIFQVLAKVQRLIKYYCPHEGGFIYQKLKFCLDCERGME